MGYRVAVVGATGNVGREMLNILEEVNFPVEKIHALTDGFCRPLAFLLTGGQVADCTAADALLEQAEAERPPGRPHRAG